MPFKYASMQERLIANTVLSPDSGYNGSRCWLWTGAYTVNQGGMYYGKVAVRLTRGPRKGEIKTHLAHRVSLKAFKGVTLGHRRKGMHLCNISICINPDHLSGGTQKANVRQCVADGRHKAGTANQYGVFV